IEEACDVAFDLERVWNRQLAIEQTANRLRNHGLAVAGRPIHKHRVGGADRRSNLSEDGLTEQEMRERITHTPAGDRSRHGISIRFEIRDVLRERHRGDADILIALEEQHRPLASGVGNSIAKRRSTDTSATDDFALMQTFDEIERRVYDGELDTEAARQ